MPNHEHSAIYRRLEGKPRNRSALLHPYRIALRDGNVWIARVGSQSVRIACACMSGLRKYGGVMSENRKGETVNAVFQSETLSSGASIRVARFRATRNVVAELRPEPTKARAAALIYAENRLFPWAKWARENRETLGHPTISLLYQAMRSTKVGVIRGCATPTADEHGVVHYPINADGRATRSFRATPVGEVPEAIVEVDGVVAQLPPDLHEVLVADFFTYGPIEVRCKATRWKRARYSQLLESAKYAVYMGLVSLPTKI